MTISRSWLLLLCAALTTVAVVGLAASQAVRQPESKTISTGRQEPSKPATAASPRSELLPSLEEYQKLLEQNKKLLDQIEQLKRQLKPDKPAIPSSCKLTGQVEGDLVRLQALFEFKTYLPNAVINLGCPRSWPVAATLDGQLPWLQVGDDGLLIQAENPGVHQAKVELLLPTRKLFKGADRGFHLDLPRAAITTLEQFDVPGGSTDIRVGDRVVHPKASTPQGNRLEGVAVVPIDYLEVSWKGQAAEPAKGPPVLAANGRIVVRVQQAQVFTEAEFTLSVPRGETSQWRILVPLRADAILDVKAQPQDESRILGIDRAGDKEQTTVTIRLKEPSSEDLRVSLRIRQARQSGPVPIGPLTVLDALTQQGEIEVRAADDLRLDYPQMRSEVSQREVSEDQRRDNVKAAFTYWNLPLPPSPPQPVTPLITIQAEPVQGAVETRVTHRLRLMESDGDGRPQWRLTTKLEATPIRTAVDHVVLSLPPNYEYDRQVGPVPADVVETVTPDSQNQVLQIKLAQKQLRPFSLTLAGSYAVPRDSQEASLELPRPLKWSVERGAPNDRPITTVVAGSEVLDRGGHVSVTLPGGLELVVPQEAKGDRAKGATVFPLPLSSFISRVLPTSAREYSWPSERAPQRVQLAWRPFRPELPVNALVDVKLESGQARVHQRLHFQFPQAPPGEVVLRIPQPLRGRVVLVEGGTESLFRSMQPASWPVALTGTVGKEHDLTLEYAVPLRETAAEPRTKDGARTSRRLELPLVQAAQATRGETKIRVWADPSAQPSATGGHWEELPTEIVPEQDSLPTLVLRAGLENSVTLLMAEQAAAPGATAVIDRVLIQAAVTEAGSQTYRARFLLSKLSTRHLEVELPMPLTDVDVKLDQKRVPWRLVDEAGRDVVVGKRLRLQVEPDLYRKPPVLELSYKIDAGGLEGSGPFQLTLRPPLLLGAVLLGRTRWQVELPPGRMPLYARGGYHLEQQWGSWGPLLAPRPAVSRNQLEQWFTGKEKAAFNEEGEPGLVCWQTTVGALPLVYVPQRIWLLVCSLLFLGLGLVLVFAPLPRLLFWSCVLAAGVGTALVVILWPGTLPAVAFGCEPGACWLLVVVGVQWMLHERQRRQIVFMPGFTRAKAGSSLIRGGSSNRKRELSTVDEPPQRGNSVTTGQGT